MEQINISGLSESEGLSVGIIFCVNSIIGTGILSIPYAFAKAGWISGIVSQLLCSLLSLLIGLMLLQVWSRCEVLYQLKERGQEIVQFDFVSYIKAKLNMKSKYIAQEVQIGNSDPIITSRRFDLTDMGELIFGRKVSMFILGLILVQSFLALTAYISIFSAASASNISLPYLGTCDIYDNPSFLDLCRLNYGFFLALYLFIMIFFVLRGIQEQVSMQIVMFVLKMFVIILMIATCLIALLSHKELDSNKYHRAQEPYQINIPDTGPALLIILLSSVYQDTFPTCTQCIQDKKKNLPRIILFCSSICCFVYLVLGIIIPMTVGIGETMTILNWRKYSAGFDENDRPWYSYVISNFIVLFPALDVISVFPLESIYISDNILAFVYGKNNQQSITKRAYIMYRLLGVVPPFLIALFIYDLGQILDYAGMISLVIIGIYIPLMQTASVEMVPYKSSYDEFPFTKILIKSNWGIYCATLCILLGVFSLIYI